MAILFITGINDDSTIGVTLNENNKPVYLYDGNCSLHGRLPLRKGLTRLPSFSARVCNKGNSPSPRPRA